MSDRELDWQVWEKVFGNMLVCRGEQESMAREVILADMPHYSSDIREAIMVVEKMRERGFFFKLLNTEQGSWLASFADIPLAKVEFESLSNNPAASICLGALKALGVGVEDAGDKDGD